jgi:hypothetical protein
MGLLDFITGNADPPADGPRLSKADLLDRLRAVRDPQDRWHVRDATADEDRADLVAEWIGIDAEWHRMFGEAGERTLFRVLMRLDEEHAVVRSLDRESMAAWQANALHLAYRETGFRGQKIEVGSAWSFGKTDDGSFGKTDETHYSTNELKEPLRSAVKDAGWGWHGVAFGKL